jgi:hypothetical protein
VAALFQEIAVAAGWLPPATITSRRPSLTRLPAPTFRHRDQPIGKERLIRTPSMPVSQTGS